METTLLQLNIIIGILLWMCAAKNL